MSYYADNIWVALCSRWPKELMALDEMSARQLIQEVLDTSPDPRFANTPPPGEHTIPPSYEMVKDYFKHIGCDLDPQDFIDFYESKGWVVGKVKMKNWHAAANRANRLWQRHGRGSGPPKGSFMA